MPFPREFTFANEEEFITKFLVPLLQRMGFPLVVNYHGNVELGKDLIMSEIDRFGHVRYHGIQAKYVPSISLSAVEDLIRDAHQAFNNPFTHPQTGAQEFISSFYAVTGGSLGDVAKAHYFASLRKHFGDNVRVLQGKDLVTLDRWVAVHLAADVGAVIAGMLLEIRHNSAVAQLLRNRIVRKESLALARLRATAFSDYLARPTLQSQIPTEHAEKYLNLVVAANTLLDFVSAPLGFKETLERAKAAIIDIFDRMAQQVLAVAPPLETTLQQLGPLAPIGDVVTVLPSVDL